MSELIRVYLEHEGFMVVQAFDGEEGLANFRDENPDLILLDVMLPKLDGLSVCRDAQDQGHAYYHPQRQRRRCGKGRP